MKNKYRPVEESFVTIPQIFLDVLKRYVVDDEVTSHSDMLSAKLQKLIEPTDIINAGATDEKANWSRLRLVLFGGKIIVNQHISRISLKIRQIFFNEFDERFVQNRTDLPNN